MPRSFLITNRRYNEELEQLSEPIQNQVTVIVSPSHHGNSITPGQVFNGHTIDHRGLSSSHRNYNFQGQVNNKHMVSHPPPLLTLPPARISTTVPRSTIVPTSPFEPKTPSAIKRSIVFHTPPDDRSPVHDYNHQEEAQDLTLHNRRRNSSDDHLLDLSEKKNDHGRVTMVKGSSIAKESQEHVQQVTGCSDGRQLVMMITSRHGLTSVGVHSRTHLQDLQDVDGKRERVEKKGERSDPRQQLLLSSNKYSHLLPLPPLPLSPSSSPTTYSSKVAVSS